MIDTNLYNKTRDPDFIYNLKNLFQDSNMYAALQNMISNAKTIQDNIGQSSTGNNNKSRSVKEDETESICFFSSGKLSDRKLIFHPETEFILSIPIRSLIYTYIWNESNFIKSDLSASLIDLIRCKSIGHSPMDFY